MSFDPSSLLEELGQGELTALVDTMVLAADADGEFSSEEREELAESIRALARGSAHEGALAGEALGGMVEAAHRRIQGGQKDALVEAVKSRLGRVEARKAALALAIVVTAADGVVRTSEREIILELAEALEIDRDVAADLVRDITRG
jgi:tellurite resistance protein